MVDKEQQGKYNLHQFPIKTTIKVHTDQKQFASWLCHWDIQTIKGKKETSYLPQHWCLTCLMCFQVLSAIEQPN